MLHNEVVESLPYIPIAPPPAPVHSPIAPMPPELKQVIEENK
jgi:hypothetical protein